MEAERLEALAPRQLLHAAALSFVHPVTNEPIAVTSEWPADLRPALAEAAADANLLAERNPLQYLGFFASDDGRKPRFRTIARVPRGCTGVRGRGGPSAGDSPAPPNDAYPGRAPGRGGARECPRHTGDGRGRVACAGPATAGSRRTPFPRDLPDTSP